MTDPKTPAPNDPDPYQELGPTVPPSDSGYLDGESQRLLVPALGEDVEVGTHFRFGPDGGLYRYDDGVYLNDGNAVAEYRARALLGYDYMPARVSSTVEWLLTRERINPLKFDPPPGLVIYAANGIVRLDDDSDKSNLKVEAYTRENAWLARVPWRYEPGMATPVKVPQFLDEISGGDPIWTRRVLALIGYGMIPGNPLRRALLLHGQGRNGKSILLYLWRALYGEANVSTTSLEQLTTNRFMASELRGKLANICGDIGPHVGDIAVFNQLTGGDPIAGERKFGQPFTFRTGALPVFSSNVYPNASDPTPAYMGRYEVIPFDEQFAEDAAKEAELKAIADDPTEMACLFNLAVLAAYDLVHHKSPTVEAVPARMKHAKAEFWKSVDSVKAFVDEACEIGDDDYHAALADLYTHYQRYCTASGMHPLKKGKFSDRIDREEGVEKGRLTDNVTGFRGLRLSEDWQAESGVQLDHEFGTLLAQHPG